MCDFCDSKGETKFVGGVMGPDWSTRWKACSAECALFGKAQDEMTKFRMDMQERSKRMLESIGETKLVDPVLGNLF